MAKRFGTPQLNSPGNLGNATPRAPSSAASSMAITTAAQARNLLRRFPNTSSLGPSNPPWPREASEDHLALQLIDQNGGPVNPAQPFRLRPKTLAWLQALSQERSAASQSSSSLPPGATPPSSE